MWLAENTGHKKSPKIRHLRTTAQHRRAIFATKACINYWKKHVKQRYLIHMFSQYCELQPTNG